MSTILILQTINNIKSEVNSKKCIPEKKKEKYLQQFELVREKFNTLDIEENFKAQYDQLNLKGTQLLKTLRNNKNNDKVMISKEIELYIRYLKACVCDFEGKTFYLRRYITSFLFCAMLFLTLSPMFYGFMLPILFFVPIYIGLRSVKNRSMSGFYMTMSVVPMALLTSLTWINYGFGVMKDPSKALKGIVSSGVAENLAQILLYAGPILGVVLLFVAFLQLYRGIKSRDLFI